MKPHHAKATKRRADKKIDPEKVFRALLKQEQLPQPETEYQFAHPRKWRFDYVWRPRKVALEVEGGVWTRGRHTRGAGFLKDMEKYNHAAMRRWVVIRTTPDTLCSQDTIDYLRIALSWPNPEEPA